MSDLEKIEVVLNEIQNAYGLTDSVKNILKDNIIKRASMYNGITPNINGEEASIIINPSSIIDIFLNRLVNNIREYKIGNTYIPSSQLTNKGDYADLKQTLTVENFNAIRESIKDKFDSRGIQISNERLNICVRKVFNHEIGHALQHSFKGNDGLFNNNYNMVVSSLARKYPNIFKMPDKLAIKKIHGGVKANDNSNYSRFLEGNKLLDEIFNESEAMEISNMKDAQVSYNMKFGNKKIYNYDSSNYKITSYGIMMKIIMGKTKTYRAMYEDSAVIYDFFNQFKDISKEVFKTDDTTMPMQAILNGLDKVRNDSNMDVANDLDLFFTKCLEKRVHHDLRNPNMSVQEIDRITDYIETFENQMIKSPNNNLQQEVIINSLKELVKKQNNEINRENSIEENIIDNTQNTINIGNSEQKENLDDYKYCLEQIENIINLRRRKKDYSDEEKRKLTGKIFYYEGYMINGLKNEKDIEVVLEEVVSKFDGDAFEKKIQSDILRDLQEKYQKDFSEKSKLEEKTQLEKFLGELRREVNDIQQKYRKMFFTEYDSDEQDVLIRRISNIGSSLYSLRVLTSNNKELEIISSLEELINGELIKMNTIKNQAEAAVKILG